MLFSGQGGIRPLFTAVRTILVCTLTLGVAYTALVTGLGQVLMPAQANGSTFTDTSGETRGSALIGQSFLDANGEPIAEYFQSRPSAAGDGYDGTASTGTNWGPENPDFIEAVKARRSQIAEFNGVAESAVPADAVTASSSGLDPHISVAYADIQIERVAKARQLDEQQVRDLVAAHTEQPALGYLGEPVVNVAKLNLALDELKGN